MRENDPDIHFDKHFFSCGSYTAKLNRVKSYDRTCSREAQPWELADG